MQTMTNFNFIVIHLWTVGIDTEPVLLQNLWTTSKEHEMFLSKIVSNKYEISYQQRNHLSSIQQKEM